MVRSRQVHRLRRCLAQIGEKSPLVFATDHQRATLFTNHLVIDADDDIGNEVCSDFVALLEGDLTRLA